MKKLIIIALIAIMLAGCGPAQKTKVDYSSTYVAQTIEAWERPITQTQTKIDPDLTPTILSTITPEPTKEASVFDKIADSLEFGYCPETKTRNAIVELRAISIKANEQTSETETQNSTNGTFSLFDTEEERTIAVERSKKLIADIEAIPVPECLRYSKSLYIKGWNDAKSIAENYSIKNNESGWFGELLKATMTIKLANEELNKIEQCLPNCKK
jgi:PBP1b-binding outer membrane lipoprotein LpoB